MEIYQIYGWIGLLSVGLWVVGGFGLLVAWLGGRSKRIKRLAVALLVAGLAVLAARRSLVTVSEIRADQSHLEAPQALLTVAPGEPGSGEAPAPRFAEERPAYLQQGPRTRAEGARMGAFAPEDVVDAGVADMEPDVRRLPEADLYRALRRARLNVWIAWLVFFGCGASLILDYGIRFHGWDHPLPLPLAGPVLDRLTRKPVSQSLPSYPLTAMLKRIICRGECFLYVGASDPLVDCQSLPRLRIGTFSGFFLPKLLIDDPDALKRDEAEYLLDAVWFGRAWVVVSGASDGGCNLLLALEAYLRQRRWTKARALRSVYVVWDLPPDSRTDAMLARIAPYAHKQNVLWIFPKPAAHWGE